MMQYNHKPFSRVQTIIWQVVTGTYLSGCIHTSGTSDRWASMSTLVCTSLSWWLTCLWGNFKFSCWRWWWSCSLHTASQYTNHHTTLLLIPEKQYCFRVRRDVLSEWHTLNICRVVYSFNTLHIVTRIGMIKSSTRYIAKRLFHTTGNVLLCGW